jgi:hypothetical protein
MLGVVPRPGTLWYDSNVKYLREPADGAEPVPRPAHPDPQELREPKVADRRDRAEGAARRLPEPGAANSQAGGLKPEIIQAAAMADNNEGEWIGQEMMNIVGLHEVSQGQVPGRVEAAKAIAELKDSDTPASLS